MTKERNIFLDVLKAISIILVVVGHCIQYGSGMEYLTYGGFFYNPTYKFIYSFHMPLFMLISGYLFSCSSKNKTVKELIIKKVKQLIIPLFCWSFVTLIVALFKIWVGVSSQSITFMWIIGMITSGFWGGPWFLWALWWSSIIVIIGKKLFKNNILFYMLICAVCFVIPDINNTAVLKFMFPFFLIAYLFNEYDLKTKLKDIYMHRAFGFSCLILFVLLLKFYDFSSFIYTTGFCVLNKNVLFQIHINCYRFLIGILGSISVMCVIYSFMDIMPNVVKKSICIYRHKYSWNIFSFKLFI